MIEQKSKELIEFLSSDYNCHDKNKKNNIVNITINKVDLSIIDYFCNVFSISRSKFLSTLVKGEIHSMFDSLEIQDRYNIADLVDRKLDSIENYEHLINKETWMYYVKDIPQEVFNPMNKSKIFGDTK